MRKLLLLTSFLCSLSMNSQIGPTKGDMSIGLEATGVINYLGRMFTGTNTFSISPTDGYSSPLGLYAKFFNKDNQAYRLAANINYGSTSKTSGISEVTTSAHNFQVLIGKEWRKGSGKIQGYYGLMGGLGYIGGSTKTRFTTSGSYINNIKGDILYGELDGFIGAEYFIIPKLGIGAELYYGFVYSIIGNSSTESNTTKVENKDGGTILQLGTPNYVPKVIMNFYF